MSEILTILGIESSCDETAAAVVQGRADAPPGDILSNVVHSQLDLHAEFGGVVPEIAARAHVEKMDTVIHAALHEAGLGLESVDAIAVTAGPGLIGGLMAGVMFAKGLALGAGLPLVGVNHLEGHALTPRLTDGVAYPYLLLLVSGGHCLLSIVDGPGAHERLGTTIDDAPGEAFDKTAKLLGLGYPGGPAVETMAKTGDPKRIELPRMLLGRPGCDFSFSGLKTALRIARDGLVARGETTRQDAADLCAAFQASAAEHLSRQSRNAMRLFREKRPDVSAPILAVAGGVAANGAIRMALETACDKEGFRLVAPPLSLCSDNAAMIAWAGLEQYAKGARDDLTLTPRSRWPLDENAAPVIGSGKRGAKA